MNQLINSLINALKWPLAIVSLAALPGSVYALIDEIEQISEDYPTAEPLLIGFAAYMVLWTVFLRSRSRRQGSFWSTFEHELTHILFTVLSFGRVRGLVASHREGGLMQHEGSGNWLITVSPYFFPTLAVPILLIMLTLEGEALEIARITLGIIVAYHLTSTYRETHRHQTDLQRVGFGFAWCFLPTANLMSYGLVLGMSGRGLDAFRPFGNSVWDHSRDVGFFVKEFIQGLL
jgi:hypothetical protein